MQVDDLAQDVNIRAPQGPSDLPRQRLLRGIGHPEHRRPEAQVAQQKPRPKPDQRQQERLYPGADVGYTGQPQGHDVRQRRGDHALPIGSAIVGFRGVRHGTPEGGRSRLASGATK